MTTLTALSLLLPAGAASQGPDTVTIYRDEFGVPHLYGRSAEALYYGMGYVSADDRLWQAEILRRSATGTLAEFFGPSVLPGDIEARTLFGSEQRRADLLSSASSELQALLSAYAQGVNARIAEGDLPAGYGIFGPPRTWTPDDTMAIFMMLASRFGVFGWDELYNVEVWDYLVSTYGVVDATTIFGDLYWLDDPDAVTIVPEGGAVGKKGRRADGPVTELPPASAAGSVTMPEAVFDNAGLPPEARSSNALVISPRLSKSGSALLLSGPQLGYGTPQISHEVGLHGGGLDVTGISIAGGALIPIGVGMGYAWALTSGGSDNSDIFVETLNPANPGQYLFEGAWRDLDCRLEEFDVAGAPNHTQTLCWSVHGPILGSAGDLGFALASVAYGEELNSLESWIALGGAKGLKAFEASVARVAYNFNVFYADRTGNIAYWHMGHIPVRAEGVNPFFPTPGTGEYEWQGILPFEQNPRALNPERGYLVNWNNKPEPGWENSTGSFYQWGDAHRVHTLREQLDELAPRSATVETVGAINRIGGFTTDTPTGQGSTVFVSSYLDAMLDLVDTTTDSRLNDVVSGLRSWDHLQVDDDGDGFYDDPYGTIFNAWWFALANGVFDEVIPVLDRSVAGNLVDHLLKGPEAGLPLQYDYLDGRTIGEAVSESMVAALDGLTGDFGTADMTAWLQPVSLIEWSPLPLTPAAPNTIWMNRGTYNQIVDLRGNVSAQNVVAPGQSGEPGSDHFLDQLGLYTTWDYKPMHLTKADLDGLIESSKTLILP
jgi:penicillin amidase